MADKAFRNHGEKAAVKYTLRDFLAEFPNDDACLDWLMDYLYPHGVHCEACGRVTKHHRVKSRKSYSCDVCGHHVHPTAGTIYHKSSTSLRLWFYAIYLMSSTRCGISAKQLERELGVTYKTAWRMFKQIRSMLQVDDEPLDGNVEIDETYVGGRKRGRKGRGGDNKTPVVGAVERGGRVKAFATANVQHSTVLPIITEHVLPTATVFTDEYVIYDALPKIGYEHHRIHHQSKVYVMGNVHTQTIEGFWSLVKNGIGGVYHSVSQKYLQSYLDEYAFRYNNRKIPSPMFKLFLGQISSPNAEAANARLSVD